MKDALAIHRMLLERETLHEIVRLPSAISHADELPKVLDLPAERCLVTHVYTVGRPRRDAKSLAGLIVRAGYEPGAEALEAVRRRLGVRALRPARADHINEVTEYAAHLVSPLLLPAGMPLLIERAIVEGPLHGPPADGVVYTATGEPSTALGIRVADLHALAGAEPIELPPGGEVPSQPTGPLSAHTSGPPSVHAPVPVPVAGPVPAPRPPLPERSAAAVAQGGAGTSAAIAERPPRSAVR